MIKKSLIVVGAGPAGLIAAITAADAGQVVTIFESMPKPARKLGISGKGRGNITNTASYDKFLLHFNNRGRFLKTAFKKFFNKELVEFLAKEGLPTTEERGGRVFTSSGKATDIVNCLHKAVLKRGIKLMLGTPVKELLIKDGKCIGVSTGTIKYYASNVIIATGGLSYPGTGSTGDGLRFAKNCGHEIIKPLPSLCGLKPKIPLPGYLEGVAPRNINAQLFIDGKKTAEEFGEMLFQDGYLAGPVIITLSRLAVPALDKKCKCEILIDLKPALDHQKLDKRLLRDIQEKKDQRFVDIIGGLLPNGLRQYCIKSLKLNTTVKADQTTAETRKNLRIWLKELKFEIIGHAPWEQAIVTAGGVSTKDINPTTMESRKIKNLYFAGEIIDIDADTGGFNLQAAFSTGYLAAISTQNQQQ
jgi:predicted Rossmann fold flavoprotein